MGVILSAGLSCCVESLQRVDFRCSHRSQIGGVPPSIGDLGKVRTGGRVVMEMDPHVDVVVAAIGRRSGGLGVKKSIDMVRLAVG
jgi:hypothetical protein